MAVYESLRAAEYFAIFPVRGHTRRVWLGTGNRRDAEDMERAEIAITRVTQYQPTQGNRGRCGLGWGVYDYIWEYANAQKPGGVKNMYEALCAPETYLCMQLRRFLKWKKLSMFTADDTLAYQKKRFEQGKSPCTDGHEIRELFRLLRWARLTKQIREIRQGLCRVPVRRNGYRGWAYERREPVPPPRLVHRQPRKPNALRSTGSSSRAPVASVASFFVAKSRCCAVTAL